MEKIKSTYSTACCVVHTARESTTCSTTNDTDFQYSFPLSLYHLLFENKHESTHLSFSFYHMDLAKIREYKIS